MDATQIADRAEHVAARLSLLSNANRLMILCKLVDGEQSVGALSDALGLSQSALSQHLAKLRAAGMVATRRERQTIHYRIDDQDTQDLMRALHGVFCG